MVRTRSLILVVAILVAALGAGAVAKTKFSSVWRSPDAASISFAGKKIAALVIDKDESLRIAGEEALVRELEARGLQGVPSYRFVPKEELLNAEKARPWFERAGVEGVIAFRVVNDDRRKTVVAGGWTTEYYQSLWGYYGYSWGAVYSPGYVRNERIVSLETLIFSVPKNSLVWAGLSTTENPKDGQKVVTEVVKEAVSEMRKQGLARELKK
ncbi:MAG TPA: hypothetical protein VF491_06360 [Vicinamibacterales bacterium]